MLSDCFLCSFKTLGFALFVLVGVHVVFLLSDLVHGCTAPNVPLPYRAFSVCLRACMCPCASNASLCCGSLLPRFPILCCVMAAASMAASHRLHHRLAQDSSELQHAVNEYINRLAENSVLDEFSRRHLRAAPPEVQHALVFHTGHAEQPHRFRASEWLTGTVTRMTEVWQQSDGRLDPAGVAKWSRKLPSDFKRDRLASDRVIHQMKLSLDRLESSAPVTSGSGSSSAAPSATSTGFIGVFWFCSVSGFAFPN